MSEETPQPVAHPLGDTHEAEMLEDMRALENSNRETKGVIRLHLSRLKPENRQTNNLLQAESVFSDLTSTRAAWIYRLRNTDLMIIFQKADEAEVERCIGLLLRHWSEDPLLSRMTTANPRKNRLASWFDLFDDYDKLMAFTERQAKAKGKAQKLTLGDIISKRAASEARSDRGEPLSPSELNRVEDALQRADFSSHIRRQPVCAFVENNKPEVVFTEVFVSIGDLRETLMPNTDLASNPWLFQRLTQTLDKRVLAQLNRRDDRSLMREGFSINLNIQTVLSEEFLSFDENLNPATQEIVIELRAEDIFADPASFMFARDFVHERGYRICIDGLTVQTYPYVDQERIGVGLSKLSWSKDLPGMLGTEQGDELRELILERKRGRTILARVDNENAVKVGREYGISLFQGRFIDGLMRDRY